MPGSLGHLTRRFFDVLSARPLTVDEETLVSLWLDGDLQRVFFEQQRADQRHAYEAALSVTTVSADEPEVLAAALLHDVGKRHSRLGVIGRTIASLLILAGLPLNERMKSYRDHGIIAAAELAELGAPPLAVDYALHHHGERPPSIAAEIWDALEEADDPANARTKR